MNLKLINQANQFFKAKKYATANFYYNIAQKLYPEFGAVLKVNIDLCTQLSAVNEKIDISIDIVVPVYNAFEDVQKCLESLLKYHDNFNVRIIVVNDGSAYETSDWLRTYCKNKVGIILLEHEVNKGYTQAVNTGLKYSTADYVVTQNSDTIVTSGWLTGLVKCINSDEKIGVVGPLSNAASWQNVPNLYDATGEFAINDLGQMSANDMAVIVRNSSKRFYPQVTFLNGFCFMIKREVIDVVGYMDEINFPIGYGEENDFCIRAIDAGYKLVIADDTYVFHAKSKSFGHEKKKELSRQGTVALKRKHGEQKYLDRVEQVKDTTILNKVRAYVNENLKLYTGNQNDFISAKICFLLPVKGGGGGAHSVVQEAYEMLQMGLDVEVLVREMDLANFLKQYSDLKGVEKLFVGFNDKSLISYVKNKDIVIATIFASVKLLEEVVEIYPYILPAYYIQDYETLFFEENTELWKEAFNSYNLLKNGIFFAKTHWIIDQVKQYHNRDVAKVSPSIDHAVYNPNYLKHINKAKITISAMIRPHTPRRGAERTLIVLEQLKAQYADLIEIKVFGCSNSQLAELGLGLEFENLGVLYRPQVAALLQETDIFIDLSDYQAFGRTGLEAMACGATCVLTKNGGIYEYAVDGVNSSIVDPFNIEEVVLTLSHLITNPQQLKEMKLNALQTASKFSVKNAVSSELGVLSQALYKHRQSFKRIMQKDLFIVPSLIKAKGISDSGYVRLVYPYSQKSILKTRNVHVCDHLPDLTVGSTVVMQRDVAGYSFEDLQVFYAKLRKLDGKLIYDLDDDLLDSQGLLVRGLDVSKLQDMQKKLKYLLSVADLITVSTPELLNKIQLSNDNVILIENKLDQKLWGLSQNERNHDAIEFSRNISEKIKIGYFGTPRHLHDFTVIVDAMKQIEEKYIDQIDIEIIGPFQTQEVLFGKKVGLPKKSDYPDFVNWLFKRVSWDIGIIPLVQDDFNKAKSNLKFLEYSALDMSIVVSNVEAYANIAKHQENCLVVENTTQSWVDAISHLIENKALRLKLAKNARKHIQQNYVLNVELDQYISNLLTVSGE